MGTPALQQWEKHIPDKDNTNHHEKAGNDPQHNIQPKSRLKPIEESDRPSTNNT
jgi:hypothetical protein